MNYIPRQFKKIIPKDAQRYWRNRLHRQSNLIIARIKVGMFNAYFDKNVQLVILATVNYKLEPVYTVPVGVV